jgi:hypothetical protein
VYIARTVEASKIYVVIQYLMDNQLTPPCMTDADSAQNIGTPAMDQPHAERSVAVHTVDQTDSCIFGGNSPFYGTPEPEFRLVAQPAHTEKVLSINGSARPGK